MARPEAKAGETSTGLDALADECWRSLVEGARRAGHPFHTAVLGTMGPDGPALRTVVLRAVDPAERLLVCHTDRRSAKVEQLRADSRVSWLFYDDGAKVQLRLGGTARVHAGDAGAVKRWNASPARSRRCYGVEPAPGTAVPQAMSGLPPAFVDRSPSLEDTTPWRENFAVIRTRVDSLEWLRLGGRGHLRARIEWRDGRRSQTWRIP